MVDPDTGEIIPTGDRGRKKKKASDEGADSLIETARACGANARCYLQYVLEKMPEHMDDTDRSFLDDMMPWSEAYRTYETSEMYNNLHLNLESEEEPPRRTYKKVSMYLVS